MVLGRLIRDLTNEETAAEALLACGDLTLRLRIEAMASRFGESHGEYSASAVRRFSAGAGDEDWLALMNRLERAGEPGHACLSHMLEWALKQDSAEASPQQRGHACSCGGGCG